MYIFIKVNVHIEYTFFHINETDFFFTIHKTQILKISITVRQPSPRNVNHLSSSSNIFLVLKFQLKNDNSTILQYLSKMKWNSLFFPSAKKAYIMRMLIFFLNDTRKNSMISAGYSNDCLYDVAVLKLLMAPVQSSNLGYMQQTDKPSEY